MTGLHKNINRNDCTTVVKSLKAKHLIGGKKQKKLNSTILLLQAKRAFIASSINLLQGALSNFV